MNQVTRVLQAATGVDEIASRFVTARRMAAALPEFPGKMPATLAGAYAVQDAAIALYGEHIIGWKVGRINPPASEVLGAGRLSGPAFATGRKEIGAGGARGLIYKGGFGAAEAEFMFRFGAAPTLGQAHFSLAECAALIDAVFIGFEIASSPYPNVNADGPPAIISDFGNNNGLLIGQEVADWHNSGLEDWAVETTIDGAVVGSGKASAFPDGPLGSVRFLLENLAARGIAIRPGMLVSTGAVSGVHQVYGGEHVSTRFGDAFTIECQIDYACSA